MLSNEGKYILLGLGFLLACGESATDPTKPQLQIECKLGCTETDPAPTQPGIFLTSAVTPDACTSGTDTDLDRLSNRCETDLGAAFSPELYYYNGDNLSGEPKWVARPTGVDKVLIGYLPAYYRDLGSTNSLCSLPGAPASCDGHNGDSEDIFLTVYYNPSTQHWLLEKAVLSQHGDSAVFARGSSAYPAGFSYPGKAGVYPRVWVSQGKHANYVSKSSCNSGGFLGIDTCGFNNTATRLPAGFSLNLGSRATHTPAQECMPSGNPSYEYYGSGRIECYWTYVRFRGWVPTTVGGDDSEGYSSVLFFQGF